MFFFPCKTKKETYLPSSGIAAKVREGLLEPGVNLIQGQLFVFGLHHRLPYQWGIGIRRSDVVCAVELTVSCQIWGYRWHRLVCYATPVIIFIHYLSTNCNLRKLEDPWFGLRNPLNGKPKNTWFFLKRWTMSSLFVKEKIIMGLFARWSNINLHAFCHHDMLSVNKGAWQNIL